MSGISVGVVLCAVILLAVSVLVAVCLVRRKRRRRKTFSLHKMYYGLAVASPYVGMARIQDGGSNQCISVFTAISSPENKY